MPEVSEGAKSIVTIQQKETRQFNPPLIDKYLSGEAGKNNPSLLPRYDQMPNAIMANTEIVHTALLIKNESKMKNEEAATIIQTNYSDQTIFFIKPKLITQHNNNNVELSSYDYDDGEEAYSIAVIHPHPLDGPPNLLDVRRLLKEQHRAEFIVGKVMYLILPTEKVRESHASDIADEQILMNIELQNKMQSAVEAGMEYYPLRQMSEFSEEQYKDLALKRQKEIEYNKFLQFCDKYGLAVYKLNLASEQNDFIFRREPISETNSQIS